MSLYTIGDTKIYCYGLVVNTYSLLNEIIQKQIITFKKYAMIKL